MTHFLKRWIRRGRHALRGPSPIAQPPPGAVCATCGEDEPPQENPLVFCVHHNASYCTSPCYSLHARELS